LLITGCFSDDSNDDINEISLRKNETNTQSKSYISGRFTSIDGKPLAGVLVQAYSTEVGAGVTSEVFSAYTDYIGNYVIKDPCKKRL
jgi:hypothetical protein